MNSKTQSDSLSDFTFSLFRYFSNFVLYLCYLESFVNLLFLLHEGMEYVFISLLY